MSDESLSAQVKDFVIRHITSVEQLELLLLFASDPSKSWTIQQLIIQISSSQESVSQRVKQLMEEGFLAKDGELFRFASAPPEKVAVTQELATAYRKYRVRIARTDIILSARCSAYDAQNVLRFSGIRSGGVHVLQDMKL